jgi:serine/threonine protein phosphatase 1
VDRGPDSVIAMEYLQNSWFFAVRGNHEAMLIGSRERVYGMYELWMHNGGEWSEDVSEEQLNEMATFYRTLPYIIEVETEQGKVGIVHADMPNAMTWDDTLDAIETGKFKSKQMQVFLWSRETYRKLRMSLEYPGAVKESNVDGVHRIYVGHSIVKQPASYGNMMFIDTGAYTSGNLTFVDITNEEIIMVQAA